MVEHPSSPSCGRQALAELATALESRVGPGPAVALGWTSEVAEWHARYRRAVEILAGSSGRDAILLRSIAGPPWDEDGPRPPGTMLAINAALSLERSR